MLQLSRLLGLIGLIVVSPLFVAFAVAVLITSGRPLFFKSLRVGKDSRPFYLLKFRTMVRDAPKIGPGITVADDPRITPIGRLLRKTKMDELPQLLNVIRGEMTFVGPRPEDPRYVEHYTPEQRELLRVAPGITSAASMHYRDEASLLQGPDWESTYLKRILPHKLKIEADYLASRSLYTDLKLVVSTLLAIRSDQVGAIGVGQAGFIVKRLEEFSGLIVLVHASLAAAYVTRFLIFEFLQGLRPFNYSEIVQFSVRAYLNSIIPMVVVGGIAFFLEAKFGRRDTHIARLLSGLGALSGFYWLLILVGLVTGDRWVFPRQTWLLAWAFSLAVYVAFDALTRLKPETRNKMIYHRVHHFIIDAGVVAIALWFAYLLRFDGAIPAPFSAQLLLILPYFLFLNVAMNLLWGVYSFVWRFVSLREALVLLLSVGSSAFLTLLIRILFLEDHPYLRVPFGVLLAQPVLALVGFLAVRGARRLQYNYLERARSPYPEGSRKVLLVGAGNAGVLLVRDLMTRPEFKIVGFLDDDPQKWGRVISGVRVIGSTKDAAAVASARQAREVILCMPTAPKSVIRRVVSECEKLHLRSFSIPSMTEIISGKSRVGQLRPVKMEDLLGRDSIEYHADEELMAKFHGRRILVTGAAGSIGSELARQLRYLHPSELVLLDKDESGLFEIALELREDYDGPVREVIADIRNFGRMARVFSRIKPEVIFHAAAYKHVPMMEIFPWEAILNNTIGTRNVVQLAKLCEVESFVLISTDKAVNPTNVMGASKRLAEMVVQHAACKDCASFCCVRFGNVLGSRASVVPIFQRRIAQGKNLQVTHPDIKRFFMTIPEAVQLVIQAGSLGKQGEIFVLDMGDPVKIADLAKDLIEQSGLVLGQDIDIEYTGLRPGEKLFEELLISEENGVRNTKYPKIFIASAVPGVFDDLDCVLEGLEKAAVEEDTETIYRILRSINIGYQSNVQPIAKARA